MSDPYGWIWNYVPAYHLPPTFIKLWSINVPLYDIFLFDSNPPMKNRWQMSNLLEESGNDISVTNLDCFPIALDKIISFYQRARVRTHYFISRNRHFLQYHSIMNKMRSRFTYFASAWSQNPMSTRLVSSSKSLLFKLLVEFIRDPELTLFPALGMMYIQAALSFMSWSNSSWLGILLKC